MGLPDLLGLLLLPFLKLQIFSRSLSALRVEILTSFISTVNLLASEQRVAAELLMERRFKRKNKNPGCRGKCRALTLHGLPSRVDSLSQLLPSQEHD